MLNDVANREVMDLASLLSGTPSPNPASRNRSQGFDQFMADMETRSRDVTPEPRERERERERNDSDLVRDNRNHEVHDRQRETRTANEEQREPEVAESEMSVTDTNQHQEAPADEETKEVIVDNLAEAVQIPPEMVMDLLKTLDVQPEELAHPPVANKYLQAMLKVDSPVELLTVPEYQDVLKQMTEAVVQILETQTPTEAKPDLSKLAGLVTTVEEQGQLVVTMGEEELEVKPITEETLSQTMDRGAQQDNSRGAEAAQVTQTSYEEAAPVVTEAPEVLLQDGPTANTATVVNPMANLAAQAEAIHKAAETVTQTRVDPTQVMQQIMSRVKTVTAEGLAELRIQLRPQELGDVKLRITVQNGIVLAMFVAESQRIKEIIESNFNQLRDALKEQGIEVADLFVSVEGDDADETASQYLKAQQEALRRLQRAAGLVADEEEEEETAQEIAMDNTVDFTA